MSPSTTPASHLLCEDCGYPLDALPSAGVCPECGRSIARSHPNHRVGSPWQQAPSAIAAVRTMILFLRHPRRSWDAVTVEREASSGLLWVSVVASGLLFPAGGLVVISGQIRSASVALLIASLWTTILLTLTWIESLGFRTFGRLHSRRITRSVAVAIVGHASVGWVVGAVLGLVVSVVVSFNSEINWRLGGLGVAAAVSAGAGLIVFELLTWIGVRHMKYANAPPATSTIDNSQQAPSLAPD